jgi:hypothetical protein
MSLSNLRRRRLPTDGTRSLASNVGTIHTPQWISRYHPCPTRTRKMLDVSIRMTRWWQRGYFRD